MTLTLRQLKLVIIGGIVAIGFCTGLLHLAEAGGGGGSSGGSSGGSKTSASYTKSYSAAKSSATGYTNMSKSLGKNYSYSAKSTYSSSAGWGYTVSRNEPERGGDGGGSSYNGTPTQPTNCTNKNLTTIDVFFVPVGAQPTVAKQPSAKGTSRYSATIKQLVGQTNPYSRIMVAGNQLEVGTSYEPIAQIRNSATCTSYSTGGGGSDNDDTKRLDDWKKTFLGVQTVYAGGGSSNRTPRPNDYPNNVRTQAPFGSNGSFPIRARIDLGNNTTYEWTEYINGVGPLNNGQTTYVRFPAFTTTEVGNHTIQIVTDIRHSIDPGRGCFATTTPDSAGWGCVRETSERDNDRSEAFTTIATTTSYRLTVDANDITVGPGQDIDEIPFAVTNAGNAIVRDYRYRVTIGSNVYASTTRTTSLTPGSRESVVSSGSYTAPTSPTTLPLRICARVATSTESCDDARIIVVTPQCSDRNDNDADGLSDASDPGCYTDPSDPSTYDPNGTSESDVAALPPPTIVLTARPDVVRYGDTATLEYEVTATYPIICTLTGGGDSQTVTHTPPTTTGTFITQPLQSTITFTLSCAPNVSGVPGTPTTVTETVQVIPLAQET